MAELLGGLTGSVQGTIMGLGNKGMQWLDRYFPPETRAKVMNAITKFSSEKPMLASFLASQIALSGFPLGLFVVMTISVAIFAIIVAIIFAVLGTVVFILFWTGVALIFLLPTLFVTTGIATFVWLWGVATYYILKRFNEKPIPGIHTSLKDGIVDQLGADNEVTHQLADLTGQKIEGSGEQRGAEERLQVEGAQKQKKLSNNSNNKPTKNNEKDSSSTTAGEKPKGGDLNGHALDPKKAADIGQHAGKATQAANDTKDKVSGVGGQVTGGTGQVPVVGGQVSGITGGAKGAIGI